MPPNLRSVIEWVTREGRSVVSSRNFSSCPNSSNGFLIVMETRTKSPGVFSCFATGFCFYVALEMFKVAAYYEAMKEEKLQRRRDKQVLNAGQHDLSHRLK